MFSKLTGIWRFIVPGVLVLALVAAIVFGVRGCKEDEREENREIQNTGELVERGKASGEVINAIENANDAVERPSEHELNWVCEKYDRNCS
jgi:hypothetical protein